jgi:hypothetical protein
MFKWLDIKCLLLLSLQSLVERDAVRECLEKDPQERTDDDIEILLEYMQHFPVSYRLGQVKI